MGRSADRLPGVSRAQALSQAARDAVARDHALRRQIIICAIACLCFVSPWLIYFIDHQAELEFALVKIS